MGRRWFLVSFFSANVAFAGSITSVSISDDKGCYDDSAVGTTSASSAGFPSPSCPGGGYASGGTGSAFALLPSSLTVTGAGNDTTQNPLVPFDESFVESVASSTQWVMVNGTGSGYLDFTITTSGTALSDSGFASSTVTLNGDNFDPCTIGFGSVSCYGTYFAAIPITYGVPLELSFSMTGNVEAGASLDLTGSYSLTSGQDLVDVPEPDSAWFVLFVLAAAAGARVKNIA